MKRYATIVAFLGDTKEPLFVGFLSGLQGLIEEALGNGFAPRPMPDIHATILGLDPLGPLHQGNEIQSLRANGIAIGVDVAGLAEHLHTAFTSTTATIQFGGFEDRAYALTSRGRRLFDRSFIIDKDKVVLIGWPIGATGEPDDLLDRIRRDAQHFGVTHKYHQRPESVDPDAYLVIGELTQTITPIQLLNLTEQIRRHLASNPVTIELKIQQLFVAFYEDTRLPGDSTASTPLEHLR